MQHTLSSDMLDLISRLILGPKPGCNAVIANTLRPGYVAREVLPTAVAYRVTDALNILPTCTSVRQVLIF